MDGWVTVTSTLQSMQVKINYKAFIEDNFFIKNKKGEIVPFVFNETQNYYWDLLLKEYPTLQGIRENDLKFRQPGFSSLIDGMFVTDFILSERGEIPISDSDIYSDKEEDTKVLFKRASMFYDSYLAKDYGLDYLDSNQRRQIPKIRLETLTLDSGTLMQGKLGALLNVQTASARVSGRGGTKQNIHWSEIAFYGNTEIMNAEELVTAAEQQVMDGYGKIFRETTGNLSGDFFDLEYQKGLKGIGQFKSRFLGWWLHGEYTLPAPEGWLIPSYYDDVIEKHQVSKDQCYWHFIKTDKTLNKKKLREYPTYAVEAFLYSGEQYFDAEAMEYYTKLVREPIKTGLTLQEALV